MRKSYIPPAALFLLVMLGACVSPPPPPLLAEPESALPTAVNFWDTTPSQGLVFIGAAALRSNRDESVNLALQDIARKISIFNAVEGQFLSYNKTGSGFFDYAMDTRTSLLFNQDYLGFVESLDYDPDTDVLQIDNSIFVRARFNGPDSAPIRYRLPPAEAGSARPGWIDSPPAEIAGHRVGVGYAGRRANRRDTVNASFEAAIFSIIREVASQVSTEALNYRGAGTFDYRVAHDTTISARGKLEGFYALDAWIDPSTMGVWTLAIARISGE
jgi:hypothetical protein